VAGVRRVIVGASASPGSIPALRYAETLARRESALLVAVHAWTPPGGELADRRQPSLYLRRIWAQAAGKGLGEAIDAAWGGLPTGCRFRLWCGVGLAVLDLGVPTPRMTCWWWVRSGAAASRIGHERVSRYCWPTRRAR
jgi:hypothetical protein